MAFEKICSLDDVWEGEMASFNTANGTMVLLVVLEGGEVKAYQGHCPHQEIELAEGTLDGTELTCSAHLWQFDLTTGEGINPASCRLSEYATRVEGDDIFVDVAGIEPFQAGI